MKFKKKRRKVFYIILIAASAITTSSNANIVTNTVISDKIIVALNLFSFLVSCLYSFIIYLLSTIVYVKDEKNKELVSSKYLFILYFFTD